MEEKKMKKYRHHIGLILIFIQGILLYYIKYRLLIVATMILSSFLTTNKNIRTFLIIGIIIYFFGIFTIISNKEGINFYNFIGFTYKKNNISHSKKPNTCNSVYKDECLFYKNYFYLALKNSSKNNLDMKSISDAKYFILKAYNLKNFAHKGKFYAMSYYDNRYIYILYENKKIKIIEDNEQNEITSKFNKLKENAKIKKYLEDCQTTHFTHFSFFAFYCGDNANLFNDIKHHKTIEEKMEHLINTFLDSSCLKKAGSIFVYRPDYDILEHLKSEFCFEIKMMEWL